MLKLFEHMNRHAARLAPLPEVKYNWRVESALDLHVAFDQRRLLQPTDRDLNEGAIMKSVAENKGVRRTAARKLNLLSEYNYKCCHLNTPDRIEKLRSTLQLAETLQSQK